MEDKKVDSPDQVFNFESAANQRELILARLKQGPVNTLQARQWGIMSPAARVLELRNKRHNIITRKAKVTTGTCVQAVAQYVLLPD